MDDTDNYGSNKKKRKRKKTDRTFAEFQLGSLLISSPTPYTPFFDKYV